MSSDNGTNHTDEAIERLKIKAIGSYGDTREQAIETLASFGDPAIPALTEVAEELTSYDDLAMKKIQEINEGRDAE